ncbi:UDP-N-acetylenolpyruvoylglucosamine reductase [Priestia megaterium]|uniref:UDP-N-acetylmuramate dehydrogenase n=1 Tax=Priestia megaterium TaxID=1404 RepID=UPI000BF66769|nr:UDP-N-acetylmuramate dehydrogenase [Priestia megaterium]PFV93160.1 UDP-N-acetylenolpyruvoylglucosamine reductase [Priestia megaterium]
MNTRVIIREVLKTIVKSENLKIDEPLNKYTFTKTGGKADFLVFPETSKEVQDVYQYAMQQQIPVTIMGFGSNLIIRDGGVRGIVMSLTKLNRIQIKDTKIITQSGAAISDVSKFALSHNQTGLEFACGIPGSVGGAVHMNAGAYGGEIKDVLMECVVMNKNGELMTLNNEQIGLSYRKSRVAEQGDIILEATFELKLGIYEEIGAKMDDFTLQRQTKQPLEFPSCGSVFKRPEGYFAGKLIQDSGLQGKQIGGAQVSTKHAGFIVNVDKATATDYVKLIQHVQDTVKSKFGIKLEEEVKVIGDNLL